MESEEVKEIKNEVVKKDVKEKIENREGLCNFWVKKKQRLCRMMQLTNNIYCAEHIPVILPGSEAARSDLPVLDRQRCPFDPKHTVAIYRMEQHLKKCNSRPPANKEYYLASANTVQKPEDRVDMNILTMEQNDKLRLIMKLVQFHRENVDPITDHFGIHGLLMSDFVKTDVGREALRHSTQIGSIAKLLEDNGLLRDSTCFIEFGSGRGGLSYGLTRVIHSLGLKNCKFILIDRTSPRYKKDNIAKKDDEYKDVEILRIKISIEDLLVGKLPGIETNDHIIGITKHLCGSGTDVALRSLLGELNTERHKVRGLVFATCCHHRTEITNFAGSEFLSDDFSGGNFRALGQMAAWATNGDYESSFIKDKDSVDKDLLSFFEKAEERYPEILLKKTVGRMVKEILDHCRVNFIKKCSDSSLKCKLVNYVDIETTRENVAILGHS